ncbi:MAG: SPASM domain-containing protein [bacterium]
MPCAAGYATLLIVEDGGVYPCTVSGIGAVGNIKTQPLDEIWYSDKMNRMRRLIKSGRCRCWTACNMCPSLVNSKWREIGRDYLLNRISGK